MTGIYRQACTWGEYDVLLYKKYRSLGIPKLSWKDGIYSWGHLIGNLSRIRSKPGRRAWLWGFAWRFGRVQGCIKYRVLAL
jgi:hypothetical protein